LKANEIFKNYLTDEERVGIDKAWKEYCYHPDNPNVLSFEQYSWKVANKGKDYEKSLKDMALARIRHILSHASRR